MIYKFVTRVIQYFCFCDRPMKGGDILDFWEGGGEGVIQKRGSITPPYQLCMYNVFFLIHSRVYYLLVVFYKVVQTIIHCNDS